MNANPPPLVWLNEFAACVRNRDLAAGQKLFSPDVLAFGTYTTVASGLTELTSNQWKPVWHGTRDFQFLADTVKCLASAEGSLVCVLAEWKSQGLPAEGEPFERHGRCTIILQPQPGSAAGYWAVHTHFSKAPQSEV